MREQFINIFEKIIEGGIILLAFFLPLIFFPQASDFFEFPKQVFLFFAAAILTLFWVLKQILEGKVKILHSPLTLPIFIFFGIFSASTIFSVNWFTSLFGPYPRFHNGLVSLVSYLLIFFLIIANLREKQQVSRILASLSLSGFVLAILGIFHFFDIYPLGNLLKGRFLTLLGSADRTSLFLVMVLPFPLFTFFFNEKRLSRIFYGILSFFLIFYIFLISPFPASISILFIFFFAFLFSQFKISRKVFLRMGAFFLICFLLFTLNNWNFLHSKTPFLKERIVQHDISLDQNTGWAITTGAFQEFKSLVLGSGPGTYLYDFTRFKPIRFNQTPFWNIRFEKSSNEYFHLASNIGLLGLLSFLLILISVFKLGKEFLRRGAFEEEYLGGEIFTGIFLFALIGLFTSSFTLTAFFFWLLLALLIVSLYSFGEAEIKEIEPSLGLLQTRGLPGGKGEILPWIVGIVITLILLPLVFFEGRIFQAELQFTRAGLEQLKERGNPQVVLDSLQNAINRAPRNDDYRRAFSAITLNFALLGEQQKSLSDQQKQQLLLVALREGQEALSLAPHNIFNWENLQRVYTLVTLDQQADFLINNIFPNEVFLDPANPLHRNDWGLVYFNMMNDTELAKRNFQDAIFLKSNFPDAHYNLAKVYRAEGKKDLALQELDQALNFINQQISSVQGAVLQGGNIQRALNQLSQFKDQIEKEKTEVQQEIEKAKTPPPEEEKEEEEEKKGE